MRCLTPDTPETRSLTRPLPSEKKAAMTAVATLTPETTPTKSLMLASTTPPATAACFPKPPEQTQTRRRPIRTYSRKRPFSDTATDGASAAEPATKRQSTQRIMAQRDTTATGGERPAGDESRRQDGEENAAKRPATCLPSPRERTGILRYFQPEASPPRRASPTTAAAAAAPVPLSSLSHTLAGLGKRARSSPEDNARSPPAALKSSIVLDVPDDAAEAAPKRRRQKRRLTIRPDNLSSAEAKTAKAAEATRDDGPDKENQRHAGASAGGEHSLAASSSQLRQRPAARAANTAPAVVQTTLSLAILSSDGAGGSGSVKECRECNILYNPLHEKDAKFHARYHASFCRNKKMARQEER